MFDALLPILTVILMGSPASAHRAPVHIDPSLARRADCHMDGCWWVSFRSLHLVRRDASGALYHVTWLSGGSAHPNGHYPSSARGVRIVWERTMHQGYEFCSRGLQTSIEWDRGKLVAHVLNFPPAGFQQGALNIHAAICQPGANTESPSFARRFGYSSDVLTPEYHLDRPEDIFRYARRTVTR